MEKKYTLNIISFLLSCRQEIKNISILFSLLLISLGSFAQKDTTEMLQTAVLKGIWFADKNNGYAVGYNGTILKTTDAGLSWKTLNSGTTNSLFSVSFTNVNTGIVCGASGLILKTTDGGLSWKTRPSGSIVTLHEVFFLDSVNAYIANSSQTDHLIPEQIDHHLVWRRF